VEAVGLKRAKNAWNPQRDTTALEQCEAKVWAQDGVRSVQDDDDDDEPVGCAPWS
jgi:hypothetical protein